MNAPKDATWLAHRYDATGDSIHFVPVSREQHRAATFLTDEYLPQAATPTVIGRPAAITSASAPGPVHFIFHSAFCCSTLLARALDREGLAMGLSEPQILNDIVGWRHRAKIEVRQVAMLLDNTLNLLARPFEPGEATIIKPSNLVNVLAPALMALRPESKALILHAPLETFLGSIARKGLWGRLWVRDLYLKLLREDLAHFGMNSAEQLKLTDIQVAAVCWLTQHKLFAELVERFGQARVRTLNSDLLMAHPEATLGRLASHFKLPATTAVLKEMAAGPAFTRHSKSGAAFSAEARQLERQAGLEQHADEIGKVVIWAGALSRQNGIDPTLPAGLLG